MCQFSGKTNNFDLFDTNWPKKGFWDWKIKNLISDSKSPPRKDNLCQIQSKWTNLNFLVQIWGKSWVVQVDAWPSNIHLFKFEEKINILFSRYLDSCASVKLTDFKISDIIIGITSSGVSTSAYFFWILSTMKKKFGQVLLVCCKTNISNMFLVQGWRFETSSRLFYDFIKMTI